MIIERKKVYILFYLLLLLYLFSFNYFEVHKEFYRLLIGGCAFIAMFGHWTIKGEERSEDLMIVIGSGLLAIGALIPSFVASYPSGEEFRTFGGGRAAPHMEEGYAVAYETVFGFFGINYLAFIVTILVGLLFYLLKKEKIVIKNDWGY